MTAPKPPFDILRAAFVLVAVVVIVELVFTMIGAIGCFWLIFSGGFAIDACTRVSAQARDIFAELLTAVLALLLAGRRPPPP